jgi:pimeloyl-ACP methyl ester carboxylesterase
MRIQLPGRRIYAYTGGRAFDPASPVVVFVHGAQHDHSVWALQSRYLAHHGRAALALDLPGHGRSDGPLDTSIEAMADTVLAASAAAGAERIAVVGHSMGSLIALECAARAPDRLERIALLGVAFPMKVSDALLTAAADDEPAAFDMINRWSHSAVAHHPGAPAPGFSVYWQNRRLMARQPRGTLLSDFRACDRYSGGLEAAARVRCPVRFVVGQRDAMTPPKAARALFDAIAASAPDAAPSRIEIAGSGHAMMAEYPDQVLDALKDFV